MAGRKWSFGFTIKDFQQRLRELGFPSSTTAIKNWESQGLIKPRRTPGGWRVFVSIDEMDDFIRKLSKRKGAKKAPEEVEPEFGVKEVETRK